MNKAYIVVVLVLLFLLFVHQESLWPPVDFPPLTEYIQVHQREATRFLRGDPRARMVFYVCDGQTASGGLGDRLRMITTALTAAILTDRGFGIRHTVPVALEDYMAPAFLDWAAPGFVLSSNQDAEQFVGLDNCGPFMDRLGELGSRNVLVFRGNCGGIGTLLQTHEDRHSLGKLNERGLLLQMLLRLLFRPSDRVASRMGSGRGVGLHVRTGGDGLWSDPQRLRPESIPLFADAALALNGSSYYIASDSQRAIAQLQVTLTPSRSSDLEIAHLERSSGDHLRTFVDWWVLAGMDALVISRSGFGEMASAYSCSPAMKVYDNGSIIAMPRGECVPL